MRCDARYGELLDMAVQECGDLAGHCDQVVAVLCPETCASMRRKLTNKAIVRRGRRPCKGA